MKVKIILLLFLCVFVFAKQDILLLKEYKDQNISGWLMSEKLDGIRAIWDGKKLISRNENIFFAPTWFVKNFPPFKLDGELYSKANDFENISSITSKKYPNESWKQLKYYIFEVPNQDGNLTKRLEVLQNYLKNHDVKYIKIIKQIKVKNKSHMKKFLKEVEKKGGEGVVLRDANAKYIAKRTSKALKVKSFHDSECVVVAIHKGKGKYKNKLGSLTCKDSNISFKIGSGFSDAQRTNPPSLGDIITYKHQGYTKNKKPRFPVFLRIRFSNKLP